MCRVLADSGRNQKTLFTSRGWVLFETVRRIITGRLTNLANSMHLSRSSCVLCFLARFPTMPTHDNELVEYDGVDWEKIPNRYKRRRMWKYQIAHSTFLGQQCRWQRKKWMSSRFRSAIGTIASTSSWLGRNACWFAFSLIHPFFSLYQATFYRGECEHALHELHMCQHLECAIPFCITALP